MPRGKIIDYDHFGRGIKKDGKTVFIPATLIGEEIEYEIVKSKKNYDEGVITKLINSSSKRIEAKCPYFEKCGGCDLQHMSYKDTLEYKSNKLKDILKKYSNISNQIELINTDNDYNYRNKVSLKIVNSKIGYFSKQTNLLVEINECLIAKKSINSLIKDIDLLDLKNAEIIIRSNYNDELLIIITSKDENKIQIEKLKKNHKIVGIIYNDNIVYGGYSFIEIIDKLLFKVSYNSFFQINNSINEKIFKLLDENILVNSNVLDLYCGVGSLGISIANKSKQVFGIEIIPNAIKNALINAKMNNLTNLKYFLGSTDKVISNINEKFDVIILDPPRKGLVNKDIEFILKNKAKQLIYISCDPMTLARDLNKIKEKYEVKKIYLLDMFPYTYHIESMIIFTKK